jgi:hypothetical protein
MASTKFVTGLIGAGPIMTPHTEQMFTLGTPALGDNNETYVYVRASETVATGTCTVSAAFALTDAAGTYTADVAFASGEYGFVRKTTTPL